MSCKQRLEVYLRENAVPYHSQHHARAITAQEVAATEHVPGRMFAKTVMVTTKGGREGGHVGAGGSLPQGHRPLSRRATSSQAVATRSFILNGRRWSGVTSRSTKFQNEMSLKPERLQRASNSPGFLPSSWRLSIISNSARLSRHR